MGDAVDKNDDIEVHSKKWIIFVKFTQIIFIIHQVSFDKKPFLSVDKSLHLILLSSLTIWICLMEKVYV